MNIRIFLTLLALFVLNTAHAQPTNDVVSLSKHSQWLHLLHYRPHGILQSLKSENDSPDFFLAPNGKTNALAELKANIREFSKVDLPDNASLQCTFPARYHWLKTYFPSWQDQPCSELDAFQKELAADSLVVIFPAAYLNSPSSMFGHSLIRLDNRKSKKSNLLSYSINFAANADTEDSEIVFSFKGVAGGYPGITSVLKYYVKVKEYSHLEHRDVWEYELPATQEEIDQFIRHVWEVKDSRFDYYFADENCSYRLLTYLDAASERFDLAKSYQFITLPVDTIRTIADAGLVGRVEYRPSASTQLNDKIQQLDTHVEKMAVRIAQDTATIDSPDFLSLSEKEQAQALEVAFDYVRYLVVKKKQHTPELRKASLAILSARSKRPKLDTFKPMPTPSTRDDEGHQSSKVNINAFTLNNSVGGILNVRFNYHDLMDLPDGFVKGAQIQMGDTAFVFSQSGVRLKHFRFADVISLIPRTRFQHDLSWRIRAGADRLWVGRTGLFAHLDLAKGLSYRSNRFGQVYGLLESRLKVGKTFEHYANWSAGLNLGWLLQKSSVQAHINAQIMPTLLGDKFLYKNIEATLGVKLSRNGQLRFGAQRQMVDDDYANLLSIGVHWYF